MRYKLNIDQEIRYSHEVTIETDVSENELDKMLDEFEREASCMEYYLGDLIYALEKKGFKIIDTCEDEDGRVDNIECTDYEEID